MSATAALFIALVVWLTIGAITSIVMARRGHDPYWCDLAPRDLPGRHRARQPNLIRSEAIRMKVVIVYESMYGNTHHVANAIGAGLRGVADVAVVPVEQASEELVDTADLLVVGGPTHVHGMSRPSTRKAAVEGLAKNEALELDPEAEGPGLRTWIPTLSHRSGPAAAFDTRMHGSPCSPVARRRASHISSRSAASSWSLRRRASS